MRNAAATNAAYAYRPARRSQGRPAVVPRSLPPRGSAWRPGLRPEPSRRRAHLRAQGPGVRTGEARHPGPRRPRAPLLRIWSLNAGSAANTFAAARAATTRHTVDDVVCIQETQLNEADARAYTRAMANTGYRTWTVGVGTWKWGLAISVRQEILATMVGSFHGEGGQWVAIATPCTTIVGVYRSPSAPAQSDAELALWEFFAAHHGDDPHAPPVALIGDWNAPPASNATVMATGLRAHGPGCPTRNGGARELDYVLCRGLLEVHVRVAEEQYGDHLPIRATLDPMTRPCREIVRLRTYGNFTIPAHRLEEWRMAWTRQWKARDLEAVWLGRVAEAGREREPDVDAMWDLYVKDLDDTSREAFREVRAATGDPGLGRACKAARHAARHRARHISHTPRKNPTGDQASFRDRRLRNQLAWATHLARSSTSEREAKDLRRRLARAGVPPSEPPATTRERLEQ